MEIWKSIPGYEGTYEVSNLGRIRSLDRIDNLGRSKKGVILALVPQPNGRLGVNLRGKNHKVHVLVLTAFKGPRPRGMEGCHGDGNHTNNKLDNLRWDTRSSNTKDSVKHGTHKETRKIHCPEGHPLEEPNLVKGHLKRGWRQCLTCQRKKSLEAYYRKAAIKAKVAV